MIWILHLHQRQSKVPSLAHVPSMQICISFRVCILIIPLFLMTIYSTNISIIPCSSLQMIITWIFYILWWDWSVVVLILTPAADSLHNFLEFRLSSSTPICQGIHLWFLIIRAPSCRASGIWSSITVRRTSVTSAVQRPILTQWNVWMPIARFWKNRIFHITKTMLSMAISRIVVKSWSELSSQPIRN